MAQDKWIRLRRWLHEEFGLHQLHSTEIKRVNNDGSISYRWFYRCDICMKVEGWEKIAIEDDFPKSPAFQDVIKTKWVIE